MGDAELVELRMRRGTLLVIIEFLARRHDEWSKSGLVSDDLSDCTFVLSKPDPGERVALWKLESEIEKTFPEIFAPDYGELVASEKKKLSEELYGPGVAGKLT